MTIKKEEKLLKEKLAETKKVKSYNDCINHQNLLCENLDLTKYYSDTLKELLDKYFYTISENADEYLNKYHHTIDSGFNESKTLIDIVKMNNDLKTIIDELENSKPLKVDDEKYL